MGLTCHWGFSSSINVCFRSQDENWQNQILEASLLNVTPYDLERVGAVCNKVEDSVSSEKEFSIL